jgi:hypothetical protein
MDIRGVYRFSSLVKQNKKAKICFVIYIAGKRKLLFYIYDAIVKHFFINGPLITTYINIHGWSEVSRYAANAQTHGHDDTQAQQRAPA